ncbi:MAG: hypothetical protein OD815_001391 [Candidatus Alkanophagales archaeon MCA70_species_2]|nr:hypothetical protein [Candidatus Alkanophaga liquidiphilum]
MFEFSIGDDPKRTLYDSLIKITGIWFFEHNPVLSVNFRRAWCAANIPENAFSAPLYSLDNS